MKAKILYTKGYVFWWATGAMIFPFIIVSRKSNSLPQTIRHEEIHFAQCLELWVIGFYIKYLYYLIKYGYRNNPFEKEAYKNSWPLCYLDTRKKHAYKDYES